MGFDTRAYDDESGRPVVVLVATGSHSVSRLVAALRKGSTEQMMLAGRLLDQVKRHNGGREALRLLAAHGGPDLLAEETKPAWHTVRRYLANPGTDSESDELEVTHPQQCHLLPAGAVCWYDHAGDVPWWPWDHATYQIRLMWETNSAEPSELVQVMQVKAYDPETATWREFEDIRGDFARCATCHRISAAGAYTIIANPDRAIAVCTPCRQSTARPDRPGRPA